MRNLFSPIQFGVFLHSTRVRFSDQSVRVLERIIDACLRVPRFTRQERTHGRVFRSGETPLASQLCRGNTYFISAVTVVASSD